MPTAADRVKTERRDSLILELYEGGAKYKLIKQALIARDYGSLSESRIGKIIRRELDAIAAQRQEIAERMFDLKLEQLNAIVRTNFGVINAPCKKCKGDGVVEDPDKAEGNREGICERCKGDGKAHTPRDRKGASMERRLASDQQCKMLGLYAPEKFAFTDPQGNALDFMDDLSDVPEEQLDRDLKSFQAGIDAARVAFADEAARKAL